MRRRRDGTGRLRVEGARRRPCREGEGAGLGAKPVTGREGKLLLRGIGEGITEDDKLRWPAELLVAAAMEMGANGARVWARAGRALKVRRERVRERRIRPATVARIGTREGGRARHGVQGWPARGVDDAVRGHGMARGVR